MILEVDSSKYRELLIDNEAYRNIKRVIQDAKLNDFEKLQEISSQIHAASEMKKEFLSR